MKAIDGIWAVEYQGAFGWERTGFLLLSKGTVIGGGRNHYSHGTYRAKGKHVTMELSLDYYGEPRTLFGVRARKFEVTFDGVMSGKRIIGNAIRRGKKAYPLHCRLTHHARVPDDKKRSKKK